MLCLHLWSFWNTVWKRLPEIILTLELYFLSDGGVVLKISRGLSQRALIIFTKVKNIRLLSQSIERICS